MPIRAFTTHGDDRTDIDRAFRWRWIQENMPSGKQRAEFLVSTRRLSRDLWHHHLKRPYRSKKKTRRQIRWHHRHLISKHQDCRRAGLAHISGWTGPNWTFRVEAAAVRPSQKGNGYGRLAYRECLRVHGKIRSDKIVSENAEAVYRWFARKKAYRVRLGRHGDRTSRHTIELKRWKKN